MASIPEDHEALTADIATALELDAQFVAHVSPGDVELIARIRKAGHAAGRRIGHRLVTWQSDPSQREDGLVVVIVALQGHDLGPDDIERYEQRARDVINRIGDESA